jgi:hypothetical protein
VKDYVREQQLEPYDDGILRDIETGVRAMPSL